MSETYTAMLKPKSQICLLVVALTSLISAVAWADGIRKVVREDGVIEYTNVPNGKQGIAITNNNTKGHGPIYKYKTDGITAYTDQKPTHADYQVIRFDCYACKVDSTVDWHNTKLNFSAYADTIAAAAEKNDVDAALVRALIHAESSFNPAAVSNKGAQGLMQLMPATAKDLGVSDSLNAEQNIHGGVRHLADLLRSFNGDVKLAAAAYNAGAGAVRKYGGIPPYAETKVYVERVGILRDRYNKGG